MWYCWSHGKFLHFCWKYVLKFIYMCSNLREILTETFTKTIAYKSNNYIWINETISILIIIKVEKVSYQLYLIDSGIRCTSMLHNDWYLCFNTNASRSMPVAKFFWSVMTEMSRICCVVEGCAFWGPVCLAAHDKWGSFS